MSEKLNPDDRQQEKRSAQAKQLAERIETLLASGERDDGPSSKVTLKGEVVDANVGSAQFVITANGDDTFSIANGPSHISQDEVLQHVTQA